MYPDHRDNSRLSAGQSMASLTLGLQKPVRQGHHAGQRIGTVGGAFPVPPVPKPALGSSTPDCLSFPSLQNEDDWWEATIVVWDLLFAGEEMQGLRVWQGYVGTSQTRSAQTWTEGEGQKMSPVLWTLCPQSR